MSGKVESKDEEASSSVQSTAVRPLKSLKEVGHWHIVTKKPYLSPEAIEGVLKHKYASNVHSITFKYCWGPFADYLVTFLPDWVAPNLITFFGFLNGIVPLFLMLFYYGTAEYGNYDGWIMFVMAWAYFAYRVLDEMDGKQARRTKNSSPLGLIFDHGCDAFSLVIWGFLSMKWLQNGQNVLAPLAFMLMP